MNNNRMNLSFIKNLTLSILGYTCLLSGLLLLTEDTSSALFLLVIGVLFLPRTWKFIQARWAFALNWKQKFGIIVLLLFLLVVFADTEQPEDFIQTAPAKEVAQDESASTITKGPEAVAVETQTADREITSAPENTGEAPVESVQTPESEPQTTANSVKVVSVTDGDTLKINLDGRVEVVRVIGINTPETVHPTAPVECYGAEASKEAKRLLSGQIVVFSADNTQGKRDKYDRLLGYIELPDGRDFGEQMIQQGFSKEYTYASSYVNQSRYQEAEAFARQNKNGLWADSACADFDQQQAQLTPSPSPSNSGSFEAVSECVIKGNISSNDDEKIYHVPSQQHYSRTKISEGKGERWFCTETEAREAGWRRALQ